MISAALKTPRTFAVALAWSDYQCTAVPSRSDVWICVVPLSLMSLTCCQIHNHLHNNNHFSVCSWRRPWSLFFYHFQFAIFMPNYLSGLGYCMSVKIILMNNCQWTAFCGLSMFHFKSDHFQSSRHPSKHRYCSASHSFILSFFFFLDQLDSKAQNALKEAMKNYNSESGMKESWDNVQKMVSTLSSVCLLYLDMPHFIKWISFKQSATINP